MLIPNRRIDVLETSALVPDFTAAMSGDQSFSLSSFKGSKLVLYFYPKDNTPGCTTEAMNFRDLHEQFAASGARVFGLAATVTVNSKIIWLEPIRLSLLSELRT